MAVLRHQALASGRAPVRHEVTGSARVASHGGRRPARGTGGGLPALAGGLSPVSRDRGRAGRSDHGTAAADTARQLHVYRLRLWIADRRRTRADRVHRTARRAGWRCRVAALRVAPPGGAGAADCAGSRVSRPRVAGPVGRCGRDRSITATRQRSPAALHPFGCRRRRPTQCPHHRDRRHRRTGALGVWLRARHHAVPREPQRAVPVLRERIFKRRSHARLPRDAAHGTAAIRDTCHLPPDGAPG